MGRQFKEFFPLRDGGRVGYSLKKPKGRKFYAVQFIGPDGEYQRVSTGLKEQGEARVEASRVISRHFYPEKDKPKSITWDKLIERLEAALIVNNNREATFKDYKKTIGSIRETLPGTSGPLDITAELAQQFKEEYIGGTFSRAKGDDAKKYKRTHTTLNSAIRKARSIWSKWLIKTFKLARENPWLLVDDAAGDKKTPKAPAEDVVTAFLKWLWEEKYPGWKLPLVFVKVKCVLGCRLMDLCSLRAEQLVGGRVEFDAEQVKGRADHTGALPAEMAAELAEVRGAIYLWDRYPAELRRHLIGRRLQHGRVNPRFDPKTFYGFVGQLFKDFTTATGKKLRSHDFRKRAVTMLVEEGWDDNRVASQVGMTVQNLRQSYLDTRRIRASADLAAKLVPNG